MGQRTEKHYQYDTTVGSTNDLSYTYDTEYGYDDAGRLMREVCTEQYSYGSTTVYELIYLYNESGMIGVRLSVNGGAFTDYYYRRNAIGDVIAIYDTSYTRVVEYAYDAWGNCTTLVGATTAIGKINPIRYRGYYYDRETGYFWLSSRYYSPELCRFISPDDVSYLDPRSINGLNLYAYCNNDPINKYDPSGHFAISLTMLGLIIGAAIGATVGGIAAYNIAKDQGAEGWELFGWTMAGIVGGGIVGGALGAGAGALVTKATGILGFSIVKGNVFVVTKTMVIGHQGYAALGSSLGYGYYQISNELYNSMTDAQRWAMNSQFLQDCSKLGANFIVEPIRTIAPTYYGNISYLYYEIQYLIDKGYQWLEDLSALVKGGR